ncbi:MAG: Uma2 family endonuclease [Acidimicrobiales bacterium]
MPLEVLGPRDLEDKLGLYASLGVPAYWVVDPERPSIEVWRELRGELELVADVSGTHAFRADWPWPVEITPDDLS